MPNTKLHNPVLCHGKKTADKIRQCPYSMGKLLVAHMRAYKKNPTKQNILIKGIKKKMLSKLTQNCHLLFFLKQVLTFKLGFVQ